jgi:hypothetical protein
MRLDSAEAPGRVAEEALRGLAAHGITRAIDRRSS